MFLDYCLSTREHRQYAFTYAYSTPLRSVPILLILTSTRSPGFSHCGGDWPPPVPERHIVSSNRHRCRGSTARTSWSSGHYHSARLKCRSTGQVLNQVGTVEQQVTHRLLLSDIAVDNGREMQLTGIAYEIRPDQDWPQWGEGIETLKTVRIMKDS